MDTEKNISRRDALKIMGTCLSAAAMMSIAPKSYAAFKESQADKKSRIIFYFTATGNSLFVAKQFSDSPLSIPQELKKSDLSYTADEIGFVFPDYAASAPLIVREFLTKAKFNAKYMFSVITFGNASVNVEEWWNEFSQKNGVKFNYINSILMVDNYLPVFDMNQQKALDKHTDENLAKIIKEVSAHTSFVKAADMGWFSKPMLEQMQTQHFSMTSDRLLTLNQDKCVQCMTCANVCPHANFKMKDGKVSHEGKCEYCLACIHACPQKALTLTAGERNPNARYRNPNIQLYELIAANQQ